MADNVAEFELSEVEVDTIGLVRAGAIGEDFFLMKSKEGGIVEENVVEVVDPGSEGFWDKLKKMFQGASKELIEEMEVAKSTAEPEVEKVAEAASEEDDEKDKQANVVCEKTKEEPVMSDETVVAQPTINVEELISKIEKSVADKYDAEMGALKVRLEKAEAESVVAKEAVAEREMIQKAQDFKVLPVHYDELGKRLYQLSKALKTEDFDWLMATFTAVDKQLGAAGILSEFGTSKTPDELALEDRVEKAAKESKISYSDAMLSLSEAEQEQLLAQMRK